MKSEFYSVLLFAFDTFIGIEIDNVSTLKNNSNNFLYLCRTEYLERERVTVVEALHKEKELSKINSEMTGCLDDKLKIEKETKESLEKSLQEERNKISNIKEENSQLKIIANVNFS